MSATQDLYELGDAPEIGTTPKKMYASLIRRERYGQPVDAFRTEVVDVPSVGRGQVLVKVMAAGINYNNVWAALGSPLDVIAARQKAGAIEDFHIGGSDLSGIVWAVGEDVRGVKLGDEVVVLANRWDEKAEDIRLGGDPTWSTSQRVWGYEENYGSFAQFAVVDDYMCHPKPARLSWAEAACYMATAATAYRQLFGWPPHTVRPGDPVLIWGGAGGLGCIAIQLVRHVGGIPVAVVSSEERGEFCSSWAPRATSTGASSTTGGGCRTPPTTRPWAAGCPGPAPSDGPSGRYWESAAARASCWSILVPTPSPRPCTCATTAAWSSCAAAPPATTATWTCGSCGCGRSACRARTSPRPARHAR